MNDFKRWLSKPLGFSLLELMVVVAILGILATVAIPRFNIFRARSRQAEAKSNLGVIFTLQESFAIDHELYYDGDPANWGGMAMNTNGDRDGYGGGGSGNCSAALANNKLGFRLANCNKARYGYWIAAADEVGFTAIAYAPSDQPGDKRVFPGCSGNTPPDGRDVTMGTTNIPAICNTGANGGVTAVAATTSYPDGDAWCLDGDRDLHNYRDITEFCEN